MAILRNHIIHGGYTPLEKEAKTALDTTSKFMKLSQEEIYKMLNTHIRKTQKN